MTEIVNIGPTEPDDEGPISYPIGPTQIQRVLGMVTLPPAIGVASLTISLASLMLVQPASEVGNVHLLLHEGGSSLTAFRWASGIRMGLAAFAVVLAIVGIRLLVGRRPTVTFAAADLALEDSAVDAIEAAAISQIPTQPAWMTTILGSALIVSVVALLLNAIAFGFAMASHASNPRGL